MKVLYVTTVSDTINAFLIPHIQMLVDKGHKVDLACNIIKPLTQELYDMGCQVNDIPFQRIPYSSLNITAYKQLKLLLRNNQYDVVHCHTPVASALTRMACRRFRKRGTKVIYTVHGFHFYKGAPLIYWLAYYPIEWICAHFSDVLITINQEDFMLARRRMKAAKVEYVPGVGIDLSRFQSVEIDRTYQRELLGINTNEFLLFSVGELNQNKNHEVVIRAIAKLKTRKIHYAIAGEGKLKEYLESISSELGISDQVHHLGFRKDIAALCHAADMFMFPSLREGLPVALMEAMASGLPVICSNIRGNTDLIEDQKGGYLFPPFKIDALADAIDNMLYSGKTKKMGDYNRLKICRFDTAHILQIMDHIYCDL